MHNKQMKNSTKAKSSTKAKQMAEEKQEFEVTENTRNLEAQISAAAKPDPEQQLDDVIDLGDEVAGTNEADTHPNGALEETCPAGCHSDGSEVQPCLSQSASDCCVEQVTAGGGCSPALDDCGGSDPAVDCSCE